MLSKGGDYDLIVKAPSGGWGSVRFPEEDLAAISLYDYGQFQNIILDLSIILLLFFLAFVTFILCILTEK